MHIFCKYVIKEMDSTLMDAMRDIEKKNLTREFPWEPL